jgi:hypothetical protein
MAAIPGDVVAIFGIRFVDQKFGSVGGMAAIQQLCRELHGEAGHGDPKNLG